MKRLNITAGLISGLMVFFIMSCGTDATDSKTVQVQEADSQSSLNQDSLINADLSIDTAIVIDLKKLQFFMPEEVAELQKFTTDSVIFFMDYHLVDYFEAKTDTAFIKNFHNLVAIFDVYSSDISQSPNSYKPVAGFEFPDNIKEALDFLQTATPFIIHSCVAECTDYQVTFDLDNMILRAKETKGTLDDTYFELLKMSNGSVFAIGYSYKEWYLQTWDIGGGSMLGNKLIYQFLKKSKEFDAKMNAVDPVFEMLREDALRAALLGTYMLAPVKILEEIKLIVNENLVTTEQAASLNQLASALKANSKSCSVCMSKKLEFNCETEECMYGREE